MRDAVERNSGETSEAGREHANGEGKGAYGMILMLEGDDVLASMMMPGPRGQLST